MTESDRPGKEKEYGTTVSLAIAIGIWWFIASDPSVIAWIIALLLLCYLTLGFCLLALYFPGPDAELPPAEVLAPPPPPKQLIKDDKVIPEIWEK